MSEKSHDNSPAELMDVDAVADGQARSPRDDQPGDAAPAHDLIGEDLAAQLQQVLDEAQAQLRATAEPNSAAAEPQGATAHEPDSADAGAGAGDNAAVAADAAAGVQCDDDGCFVTPDDVVDEPAAPLAAAPAGSVDALLDATAARAQAVTKEIREMAAMIEQAVAPADDSVAPDDSDNEIDADRPGADAGQAAAAASDDATSIDSEDESRHQNAARLREQYGRDEPDDADLLSVEQVLQLVESPPPSSGAAAGPGTMQQLDEFLAGHADHAVADAFETVHDLVADEALVSEEVDARVKSLGDAALDDDDALAGRDDDDMVAREPLEIAIPAARQPASPADETSSADDARASADSPAQGRSHKLDAGDGASRAAGRSARRARSHRNRLRRRSLRRTSLACGRGVYRACEVLNRPLRTASEPTRKIIGYAALLTMAHGTLLLLCKLVLCILG